MLADFHQEMAARTIWMEARSEGHEGMLGVAHVIVNRSKAKKWFSGQTLTDCVLYPYQFSCWNTADPNRKAMAIAKNNDMDMIEARICLLGALDGSYLDNTLGATHYCTVGVHPSWVDGATFTVRIGAHNFYKDVK